MSTHIFHNKAKGDSHKRKLNRVDESKVQHVAIGLMPSTCGVPHYGSLFTAYSTI